LGGKARVPTLDGDVEVRVPGGTQNGEECVLRGRGLTPVFGGEKGDLYVSFAVQIPRSLTPNQRAILQQYADDVEGRTSTTSASSPSSSPTSDPSSSFTPGSGKADGGAGPEKLNEEDASGGGWMGWMSRRLKELIGTR